MAIHSLKDCPGEALIGGCQFCIARRQAPLSSIAPSMPPPFGSAGLPSPVRSPPVSPARDVQDPLAVSVIARYDLNPATARSFAGLQRGQRTYALPTQRRNGAGRLERQPPASSAK